MTNHQSGTLIEEPEEKILPNLDSEDWLSKLTEDEVFNSANGPAPRLSGLRRLAKPYIKKEDSKVAALIVVPKQVIRTLTAFNSAGDVISRHEEVGQHNFPMAAVTFSIEDIYGRTFSDSADAYFSNCNELGNYPTAVASARAEARTLRKLLGISAHSAEELADKDAEKELAPDNDEPIRPEQLKLINKIFQDLEGFSIKDLLDIVTARDVVKIEDLTTSEARHALTILHKKKQDNKKRKK